MNGAKKGGIFEDIWKEIEHIRRVERKNQKLYIGAVTYTKLGIKQ